MRIGEIAALVGLTTRAIRHYHHVGLLPEPERRPNGYRAYSIRDAVLLARVRRLTELGLGLDEVRDVLADDAGRELAEVLAELDADLARAEAAIRERPRRAVGTGPGDRFAERGQGPRLPHADGHARHRRPGGLRAVRNAGHGPRRHRTVRAPGRARRGPGRRSADRPAGGRSDGGRPRG